MSKKYIILSKRIEKKLEQYKKVRKRQSEIKWEEEYRERQWNDLVNKRFKLLRSGSIIEINLARNPLVASNIITAEFKKILDEKTFSHDSYGTHTFLKVEGIGEKEKKIVGYLFSVIDGDYD